MTFRIPPADADPFWQPTVWLTESGLPILLLVVTSAVSSRAAGRLKVVAVYLVALLLQLSLLHTQSFYHWGVGPIVVLLLVGGLWRACWPPEGVPESGATGLNQAPGMGFPARG